MKKAAILWLVALVLLPGAALAGETFISPIPTLGEAGLIMLGIGLMGVGVVAIRKKRR